MEYYRRVANEESLSGHLLGDGGQVRYARSCGDICSRISQNLVALHGAIGSQLLRESMEIEAASIAVVRANGDTFEVRKCAFEPDRFSVIESSGWSLFVSERVLKRVHEMRVDHLPNETGGVLIGSLDRQRNVIYVIDVLGSPKDSTEWPTLYVRGVSGLRAELERIEKVTLSNLEYIGEWHSHPPKCAAKPSQTDQRALSTLAEEMTKTGSPAVMLIVAEGNRHGFFLGRYGAAMDLVD
jgi:integrative and conjugative element protein (TIGR02256 family)